ncbi:MAG: tRNA 2-thiouridine(34) synthase MnmA [Kiritimatiellae bacterium]|nr:tRNA 2-thiouridine(34) synthase MnmA [Kiritimatiellia bacterium]
MMPIHTLSPASPTVAVGLSGGVDSSVAALLLKEQGYNVIGVTMKLWQDGKYKGGARDACFGAGEKEDIAEAEKLAGRLGIEYRVFDMSRHYEDTIVRYFRETYLSGKTPNPCVRCNATMKFGLLPRLAEADGLKFDYFATGHYARVERGADGRMKLLRAKDEAKDQSYFLYRLSQKQLERHIFPLGCMSKTEVRAIARKYDLAAADKPDSQDFYSGDVDELIGEAARPGDIVDVNGRKVGTHNGFWHYTIGQRKGLGVAAAEPYYVVDLDACRNRVVVGSRQDAVKTSLEMEDVNWVSTAPVEGRIPVRVKVRSGGAPRPGAWLEGNKVEFPAGIQGVAPGQSAVLYSAETEELLCGGIIK